MVKKAISEGLRTFLSCSHYRAIDYYLESITGPGEKCLHLAYECKNYDDFVRGVCGHCHDDSHLCAEMGFRANLYYFSTASDNNRLSSAASVSHSLSSVQESTVVTEKPLSVNPIRGILASLTRGKRKVSVSGLDIDQLGLQSVESPEGREASILRAVKKKDSLRLYYNTSKKKPFCRECRSFVSSSELFPWMPTSFAFYYSDTVQDMRGLQSKRDINDDFSCFVSSRLLLHLEISSHASSHGMFR